MQGLWRFKNAKFCLKNSSYALLLSCLLTTSSSFASFIEATIGTAVVNDATATYYNPAALTLVNNPQVVGLGSLAYFQTRFSGQSTLLATGLTQAGSSRSSTHYYLPSLYVGMPLSKNVTFGVATIANFFNRDLESNSILRYVQAKNKIQDEDLVASLGFKVNEKFSLGAGIILSHASFDLRPVSSFPALNIPDSESHNQVSNNSWGGDFGALFKISDATLAGFNYRTSIAYQLRGKSTFMGAVPITATNYHYKFWVPGRYVVSVNHFLTKQFGLIGTVQYLQWDVFQNLHIYNIATPLGIIAKASVPYHFHNTWLLTLGSHYRIDPKWIVRAAATFNQAPATGKYQISNGDSIVLGASASYTVNKRFIIDGSYAHAFIQNQNINIASNRVLVNGVNKATRDAVSLKLTVNL